MLMQIKSLQWLQYLCLQNILHKRTSPRNRVQKDQVSTKQADSCFTKLGGRVPNADKIVKPLAVVVAPIASQTFESSSYCSLPSSSPLKLAVHSKIRLSTQFFHSKCMNIRKTTWKRYRYIILDLQYHQYHIVSL